MRQFLAVILSMGLVWAPMPSAAQMVTRTAPAVSAVPGAVGAAVLGTTLLHQVDLGGSPSLSAPSLSVPNLSSPLVAPGVQASAVASAASRVMPAPAATAVGLERHPALAMIDAVQKAGGGALLTQLEAAQSPAQFEAVAAALPEGAARASIMSFSKALAAQNLGAGSDSVGALYDNSRKAEYMPAAVAAAPTGFWAAVARMRMPSPLNAFRRYALKKAEAARPVAKPIDTDGLLVPVEKLRWVPDASTLPEKASAAERGKRRIVGQDRGVESLHFGLEIEDAGYNVMVTGADGTGRETAVREVLSEIAPKRANPGDVVAAVNFADMDSPIVLKMAAGEGAKLVQGVGEMVEAMPGALRKALGQGQVAQARKQVQAKLQANAADREKAFQREAAKVKVAGGFGIEVGAQQTDETHIGIVSALTKDGVRVKPEDLDKALEGTGVTKEQVMADFQDKAKPLIEKYSEIVRTNMQEQMQAEMQLSMLEQKAVAGVVQEMVQPLAGVLSGAASREEDADHKAWRASAEAKMEAWQKKVGALKVAGLFGVSVGEGVSLTFQGKPVNQKIFDAIKAKGGLDASLTWEAVVTEALEAVKPLIAEVQELQAAIEGEHKALHENDAPLSPERRMAMGWLQSFAQDLVGNYKAFMGQSETDPAERYNVSLLVDNARTKGAPVVFEHNPSFNNLFGYAEDNKKMLVLPNGAMVKKPAAGGPTLKAGSFLKANGGFLVLNLMDLLREPGAYQSLMRMVRNGRAEIVEDGLMGAMTAKQGASYAVAAKVKVVLIGSPYLKAMLAHNDEDFARQFHAVAEFDNSFKIAAETIKGYLRFMREAVTASTGKMLDFGRDAIAGVLESAASMAESNEKLTAQFGAVHSLMQEASFWARKAGRELVAREDVDKAVSERIERQGSGRRRMKELYGSEVFKVEISGKVVGQNNGLAVMGDFGVPSRITYNAYARPGSQLIVSADQAAHSTGSSFDKSIADIRGFLNGLFGRTRTVPVEVSIAFEQQYGGIDGDSATQTMTYGVLSALSGVPIKQGIAMTGSMDQKGNIQVIGGVNHKIEGYFDVVASMLAREGREMNGEQGIMIPVTNVPDLALRPDIVEAVKAGKFRIWAVSHVSQGVEVLMGEPYSEVIRKAEGYINAVRTGGSDQK